MARIGLLFAFALLAACASEGHVKLQGQFSSEAPPAAEVRAMLSPLYGRRSSGDGETPEELGRASWISVVPDRHGYFETPDIPVRYRGAGDPPPPSFYLGFVNEKDVVYAVGELDTVFQYRTFDAASREEIDRAEACWRIVKGAFRDYGRRKRSVAIAVAPNFDSRKNCLPPGTFTPQRVDPEKALPE